MTQNPNLVVCLIEMTILFCPPQADWSLDIVRYL